MIDFYALTSPNVQKIFFALEELELPYRVITVDVRHQVVQWLMLQVASIGPTFGQVVHFTRVAPAATIAQPAATAPMRADYSILRKPAGREPLGRRQRLFGRRHRGVSLAAQCRALGLGVEHMPATGHWLDVVTARPAVQRALAKVGAIPKSARYSRAATRRHPMIYARP
jgi:glutathione S-transferase